VTGAVRKFRRAYADVELSLVEVNSAGLISGLVEGTLDAVFLRPGTAGSEELHLRLLS
jgi:hypothetical protein